MRRGWRFGIVALSCLVAPARAWPQEDAAARLGTVRFTNSCGAQVQPDVARAMAFLHSFEFGPAVDAFGDVMAKDPSCAIASWGIALAQWGNPFSIAARPAAQLRAGRAAVDRARSMGPRTAREQDYVGAVARLYDRFETVDQRTRMLAYRDQMARVAAAYPDDTEASIFYALALAECADPADKTYADQLKAGAMLEALWKAQPSHPGLAHYIIHSYDVPALAPRALAAAHKYGQIAPGAPHALHMPSHTFTRVGAWQESIDTNILSAAAAKRAGAVAEELHASDYEVYAYLQTAQDAGARKIVASLDDTRARFNPDAVGSAAPGSAGVYALAAMPARYALERGAWADAAVLEIHPSRFPYADAITHFARALGAARSRNAALIRGAGADMHTLRELGAALTDAHETYWAEQVMIQRIIASAWLTLAAGNPDAALSQLREAVMREDRTEKSAITPGPLAPARELLGEMLLELRQPKAALVEFERTLAKEPNRFRSLAGAAAAARQSGDPARARALGRQLLTICVKADTPTRAELEAARRAAGRPPGKLSR